MVGQGSAQTVERKRRRRLEGDMTTGERCLQERIYTILIVKCAVQPVNPRQILRSILYYGIHILVKSAFFVCRLTNNKRQKDCRIDEKAYGGMRVIGERVLTLPITDI